MSKVCTKCGKEKPLSEFGKSIYSPDGKTYRCLQCKREYAAWYRTTIIGLYQNIKGRENFRKRKPFKLNRKEFVEWYESQPKICHYCKIPAEYAYLMRKYFGAHGIQLSIDCKDNDLGYTIDNIVLACDRCNFIKSNIFTYEEMCFIGENLIKPKWESFPEITKQK